MCMRLADEAKYKTGTQNNNAWPDRCIVHLVLDCSSGSYSL